MSHLRLPSSSTLPRMLPTPLIHLGNSRTALSAGRMRAPGTKCRGTRGGDTVDEDMIVLRKRIREMEISEKRDGDPSTAEWMEWEKEYEEAYNSDVCEAMGLLQTFLLRTRPSVAFGLVGILLLSVPTSAIFVSCHLLELLKMVALHLT